VRFATGKILHGGIQGRTHWANLSHEYRRDLEDYREMCQKCHFRYDRESGAWGLATVKFGELRP
jgi:hypothetical protein